MGEATRDKRSSATESKKDEPKIQGWIRMHSDEQPKPSQVDEPLDMDPQSSDRKPRKLEKPIE